jgi:hypothetical protein
MAMTARPRGMSFPKAKCQWASLPEQLGHADTRMTEKHYAHLAPSYVADTIRAHFPTLGIACERTIAPIKSNKRPSR